MACSDSDSMFMVLIDELIGAACVLAVFVQGLSKKGQIHQRAATRLLELCKSFQA